MKTLQATAVVIAELTIAIMFAAVMLLGAGAVVILWGYGFGWLVHWLDRVGVVSVNTVLMCLVAIGAVAMLSGVVGSFVARVREVRRDL
jgi:hypothetical protein